MKVSLYAAISIDGFIAKQDGDSEWVSDVDSENFMKNIHECGCIILGHRTFDQYQHEIYPVDGVTNIVLTSQSDLNTNLDNVAYATSPQVAINIARERGHQQALVIGGGKTNGSFLRDNLLDEIILSVHPLVLGNGIKVFESVETFLHLEFLSQKGLGEDLLQLHYKVLR